jgi:hypothetical protein
VILGCDTVTSNTPLLQHALVCFSHAQHHVLNAIYSQRVPQWRQFCSHIHTLAQAPHLKLQHKLSTARNAQLNALHRIVSAVGSPARGYTPQPLATQARALPNSRFRPLNSLLELCSIFFSQIGLIKAHSFCVCAHLLASAPHVTEPNQTYS